jgi:hypothetical protein
VLESRSTERSKFDPDVRIQLLERDVDDLELAVSKVNDRLGKILAVCVSLLVSVSTACVLLALNLTVSR